MPRKSPPEFKRDVVRVAHRGDLSRVEVAADFDTVDGQTSSEQNELVQLRREKHRLEIKNESLRRAAAHCAAGSLQDELPAGP